MSHKIITLPDGTVEVLPDDPNEGGLASTNQPTSYKQLLKEDHAPSEILIQKPSLELAREILKVLEKYYKKE